MGSGQYFACDRRVGRIVSEICRVGSGDRKRTCEHLRRCMIRLRSRNNYLVKKRSCLDLWPLSTSPTNTDEPSHPLLMILITKIISGNMVMVMKLPILPCAEKLELVLSTAPRT